MIRRDPPSAAADPFSARCARLGPALMADLGLTAVQAAGLLGNLGHETGGFRYLQELSPAVPRTPGGWGIAQWTGPRRRAMEAWSRAQGLDPASDAANEGYLRVELATAEAAALAALKRTATLEEATEVACRRFERPGIVSLPDRMVWARRALAAIRNPGAPPARPSTRGGSAGVTSRPAGPPPRPAPHRSTPARSPR